MEAGAHQPVNTGVGSRERQKEVVTQKGQGPCRGSALLPCLAGSGDAAARPGGDCAVWSWSSQVCPCAPTSHFPVHLRRHLVA